MYSHGQEQACQVGRVVRRADGSGSPGDTGSGRARHREELRWRRGQGRADGGTRTGPPLDARVRHLRRSRRGCVEEPEVRLLPAHRVGHLGRSPLRGGSDHRGRRRDRHEGQHGQRASGDRGGVQDPRRHGHGAPEDRAGVQVRPPQGARRQSAGFGPGDDRVSPR